MNEIVRKHYPASKLPEDLRAHLPAEALVEIRITQEDGPRPKPIRLVDLIGKGENVHGTEQEVLSWIREGRDDDR
jgi:hypothetical protein